jgi:hypothetical protein
MNLLITINFSDLGICPDDANVMFRDIWARFTRSYAYRTDKKGRPRFIATVSSQVLRCL